MQFRLGSIPVRVHAPFLVMIVVLASMSDASPVGLAVIGVVMVVSVLAHELGHALMGTAFGLTPTIDLYGMGGLTSWSGGRRELTNGKRMLISLAGPLVGLALFALAWGARAGGLAPRGVGAVALEAAIWVNGAWSVFNLIPMLPLDGGNVMLHGLNALTSGRGERPTRIVSLVVSALVTLAGALTSQWMVTILAASFAVQNVRILAGAKAARREEPLRRALEDAVRSLHTGDARGAASTAEAIAQRTSDAALRVEALRVLAYAYVAEGRWSQLLQLLERGLARAIADDDLARFESAARESGSREVGEAIARLRAGRAQPAELHAG